MNYDSGRESAGLTSARACAYYSVLVFFACAIIQTSLIPIRGLIFHPDAWMKSWLLLEAYTVLTVSLPAWLYFALCEQSAWRATIGKRLLKLRVVDTTGRRIGFKPAFMRTVLKLLTWETAHLTVNFPTPVFINHARGRAGSEWL